MNSMPPVTKNLLIINCLCYLAMLVSPRYGLDLNDICGLHFFIAHDFKPWQLFTYMFMHGSIEHLFFNMFALWMFGRIIESLLGSKRFLFYFLSCGLGAGLCQELVQWIHYSMMEHADEAINSMTGLKEFGQYVVIGPGTVVDINMWTTVGASGAIYGILLAFGMILPEERLFIFPLPIPIKAKYFVIGYALIEIFAAQSNDGVAHYAHLGGMLFGFLILMCWKDSGNSGLFGKLKNIFRKKDRNNLHVYSRNY